MYMISTFLFLSSIELHIHAESVADHGLAVSFSTLAIPDDTNGIDEADEIKVSPEGLLKVHHSTPDMLAVFLLLALIVGISTHAFISRSKDTQPHFILPFYGTPALRAPPQ